MSSKKTAATEAQILTSFLLSRSTLKDIISFREFAELFPREKRSHPQVKHLYRVLLSLRQRQCEQVRRKIQSEAATVIKRVKEGRKGEVDEEAMVGIELFGAAPEENMLPLKELLKQMERAADDLEIEQVTIGDECDLILEELRNIVGDLSDLRYGKLASSATEEQVTREINHLVSVCENIGGTATAT